MPSLKQTIMRRGGLSSSDAAELIRDARKDLVQRLDNNEEVDDAEFMSDWFGLEPDYFIELL